MLRASFRWARGAWRRVRFAEGPAHQEDGGGREMDVLGVDESDEQRGPGELAPPLHSSDGKEEKAQEGAIVLEVHCGGERRRDSDTSDTPAHKGWRTREARAERRIT